MVGLITKNADDDDDDILILTDERFLLLLRPPSLILRGATFFVFVLFFFSCGFGAGFDFLRALGPAGGREKKKKRRKTQFSVTQIQEADILAFHVTSPAQDTFAFLGLGLAERGSRSLRRLRRRWLCCGGRRDLCYHGVNSSRHVGGSQGSVGSSSSPQRVVGAELAPLCAQNHHHLRHGDLWVLGSDEGPETGVRK